MWATYASKDNPKFHKEFSEKARKALGELSNALNEFEKAPQLEGQLAIWGEFLPHKEELLKEADNLISLLEKKDHESINAFLESARGGKYHKKTILLRQTCEKEDKLYSEYAGTHNVKQAELRAKSMLLIFGVGALSMLIMLASQIAIAARTSNSVEQISEGLVDSGNEVNIAVQQITQAGQVLSEASSAAAASLQETVASLEEMTAMVRSSSQNAQEASKLSDESKRTAEHGRHEIEGLMKAMNEISGSSTKVQDIIHVIDDIAFQTNLLALNAAVEAARAGEQGKGFAVVADAVRSLAQKSATSAKEISLLIQESSQKVEQGSRIAMKSKEMMDNLYSSVQKVDQLAAEISTASTEQSAGINQINTALNALDRLVQSNASSSEEIAATTQEISSQTQRLQGNVVELGITISGKNKKAV